MFLYRLGVYNQVMIRCFLFFCFIVLSGLPAAADELPDYFKPVSAEEVTTMLDKSGFASCDEWLASHPSPQDENSMYQLYGMLYDLGVCYERDLHKAVEMYEKVEKTNFLLYTATGRLAIIYAYGPEDLRNEERAEFFFLQTAIFLSFFTSEVPMENIISHFANEQPPPQILMDYLLWYKNALHKPQDERKKLFLSLEERGFEGLDYLWDEIEELDPDLKRDFLPDP